MDKAASSIKSPAKSGCVLNRVGISGHCNCLIFHENTGNSSLTQTSTTGLSAEAEQHGWLAP